MITRLAVIFTSLATFLASGIIVVFFLAACGFDVSEGYTMIGWPIMHSVFLFLGLVGNILNKKYMGLVDISHKGKFLAFLCYVTNITVNIVMYIATFSLAIN